MSQQHWLWFCVSGYAVVFALSVVGLSIWRAKKRRERPPLVLKLLRGPGESLRQRIAKFDENSFFLLCGAALVPLLIASLALVAVAKFQPQTWTEIGVGLGLVLAVFVVTLGFCFRWALRYFARYRNDNLGYFGERAVGEALLPLLKEGFRIFHDVPAQAGAKKFNIDHVVVGATGVFALETKTRRKGRARSGFEDHKVIYTGKSLIWPWTEDSFGLQQADDRARWLTSWINELPGIKIVAKPVLVLPGWYVVPQGNGPVTVKNHKLVCSAVLQATGAELSKKEIDLIAHRLEERCRDVEL